MLILAYVSITNNIEVSVEAVHLGEQKSENSSNYYVWAYTVNIKNFNDYPVKLIDRYWRIINAKGIETQFNGLGVVGEQPLLRPHGSFNYTSGTYMTLPSGVMMGHYNFINQDTKEKITVRIPVFSLDTPYNNTNPN